MNFTIFNFDTLESTNTEALNQARLGAAEGVCIVANEQTAGRGRYGRTWVSGKDAGLYMSVVMRPSFESRYFPLVTLMTGVAVHDAMAEFGVTSDIKWVNDLHVNGKKISGILAEASETCDGVAVVVGVGINLRSDSFPPYLAATSTSLAEEAKREVTRDEMIHSLTRCLDTYYESLSGENGPGEIVEQWRRRSSYFSGKKVRVVLGDQTLIGTTDGIEDNGALRVRGPDGTITVVQTGEVEQIRPAD